MPRIASSLLVPGRRLSGLTGAVLLAGIVAGLSCKESFPTAPTEVAQVMLSPRGPTMIVGDSVRLVAAALDEDFTGIDGKVATWQSGTGSVASVDARGMVHALAEGTSVITAAIDGFTDTTLVTVMPVPVDSIDVSPATLSVTAGLTGQLTATAYDDEGNVLAGRAVSWTSADVAIATVQPQTGTVTGVAPGITWIHATSNGHADSAQVTVIPVPVRQVVVSPKPAQVQQGAALQLSAATRDSIGGTINGRAVTWASRNAAIVTVGATTGIATGVATGSAYVVATSEGVSDSTLVTVAVPVIGLSSLSASFTARWSQANPAQQTIAVTDAGPYPLAGLSTSITYGAGASGWLNAGLTSTTAPATLTLQPVTGSLAPGTYTATVTVSSSQPGVQGRAVNVTFTVEAQPVIGFSNDAPQFAAQANGVLPAAQQVTVSNVGTGTLAGLSTAVSYGPGATGWLNLGLSATTAPSTLTLQPGTTALPVGTYTAFVVVSSTTDATVRPDTVTVSYVVAQGPIIGLSRTTVGASAQAFSVVPDTELVAITNAGQGTLSGLSSSISYISAQTGWLTASIDPTTAPATLTLAASASGLAAGSYSATVTISSSVVGVGSQAVTVTFTVGQQPIISLTPDSRSFSATRGGATPGSQAVTVSNAGGGTLSGLSVTPEYISGAGWLNASLNQTTATATLTLQPNTTALVGGTYSARVIVSSTVPGVAPDTVSVSYTVLQPQIARSPTTLTYGSRTRGYTDAADVSITNGGQGTLSGLSVSDDASWITTSLSGTTAPATLTITTNTTNLAAGSYTGTVTIASSLPGVTSQTVTVTITVLQPSISFGATPGTITIRPGQTASQALVTVNNGGSGTLSGLSVSDNQTWLSTSLNQTTAPATITINFSTSGLGVGTHVATVTVASTVPGVSNATFNVTVVVRWSFALDIAPMFGASAPNGISCAGCHTNSNGTAANFANYSHLTTANFSGSGGTCENRTRVIANNASGSLLYQKLAGTHTCGGNRMPDGGPSYWSAADLAKLAAWINDGAPNN